MDYKIYKQKSSYWLVALTVIFSLLLAACGDTSSSGGGSFESSTTPVAGAGTGDGKVEGSCDGKGEVSGQVLVLTDLKQPLKNAPATISLKLNGGEAKTYTTEADGTYTIKDLETNEYELEASLPGGIEGKIIEPRKKYFTVDDCYVETVSMVLLAQGLEAPAAPAPETVRSEVVYVNSQPHYSLTSNPFFWLWLFDRPHYYGYNYPPSYTTRIYNNNNVVYVPQNRPAPADSRYKYTSYSENGGGAGVKATPPVVSKGSTRLGTSGYSKPPVVKTPSSDSGTGSKGGTRNNGTSSNPAGSNTKAAGSSGSSSNSSGVSNSGGSTKSGGGNGSSTGGSTKSGGGNGSSGGGSSKGGTRSGKR